MNVWEAMQQELTNFYKLLYHVNPVVIFQLKIYLFIYFNIYLPLV